MTGVPSTVDAKHFRRLLLVLVTLSLPLFFFLWPLARRSPVAFSPRITLACNLASKQLRTSGCSLPFWPGGARPSTLSKRRSVRTTRSRNSSRSGVLPWNYENQLSCQALVNQVSSVVCLDQSLSTTGRMDCLNLGLRPSNPRSKPTATRTPKKQRAAENNGPYT